jgi:hypothetical protein
VSLISKTPLKFTIAEFALPNEVTAMIAMSINSNAFFKMLASFK